MLEIVGLGAIVLLAISLCKTALTFHTLPQLVHD